MTESQRPRTELRIYSHNVQGITPVKEHHIQKLQDQLRLDVVFLQETFKAPPLSTPESEIIMYSRAGAACIEYANENRRRGIQFRVRTDLEPLVIRDGCLKTADAEIITISVQGIVFIGAYLPCGSNAKGLTSLLDVLETVETLQVHSDIVVLGDLNTRAFALGNSKRNKAGVAFDSWLTGQSTFELHEPIHPTCVRGKYSSFLDVLLFKGPIAESAVVEQAATPYSDHTSFMLTMSWETAPRPAPIRPKFHAKRLNKFLKECISSNGDLSVNDLETYMQRQMTEHTSRPRQVRPKTSFFTPSNSLRRLGSKVMKAKKSGDHSSFLLLRAAYSKLFRNEKRLSFQRHLDEVLQSTDIQQFCTLLRRTKPQTRWSINAGEGREDAIAEELIQVQRSRPELEAYIEEEKHSLSLTPAEVRLDLIDGLSLQTTLRSRKKRKSPGPSGLTYDVLQQLEPKVLPAVAAALSRAISTGSIPSEWFHLFVKPLCKKPGQPQVRPISLLETWTKLIDVHFNSEVRRLCEERHLISPEQFGFRHGHSATDQVIRIVDYVKSQSRATILLSVDLKGAYDRVSNRRLFELLKSHGLEPAWRRFAFDMLFNRRFKVASLHSLSSTWHRIFEGIAQGLPSAPTLFNIFVDLALRQIRKVVDAQFAYADDNTVAFTQRGYEDRAAFLQRVETSIKKITEIYKSLEAELSPEKSVLLAFHFRASRDKIAGIKFQKTHRILGVYVSQRLKFSFNSERVLRQLRKNLIWLKTYRRFMTLKQRRRAYQMYVQSILDYHVVPTWPYLNKQDKKSLDSIAFQGGRFIMGAPASSNGYIACREAGILPPSSRYQLLIIRRTAKIENNLALPDYQRRLHKLSAEVRNADDSFEWLSDRLWDRYHEQHPERAIRLRERPDPKKLCKSTQTAFLIRTEQIKTKTWRKKHGQPLHSENVMDVRCRYCECGPETVLHLLNDCPHPQVRAASDRLHLRTHIDMPDEPPKEIDGLLRRSSSTGTARLQDELLHHWILELSSAAKGPGRAF
jgi:hypothetical protein